MFKPLAQDSVVVSVLCLGLVELPASQSSCGWIVILVSEERSFAFLQPHDVSFDFDCDNIERRTLTQEQKCIRSVSTTP